MGSGTARLDNCDWESAQGTTERPIRVLYVGDDPEFAGVVAHQLEVSGNVAVDTAASGPEGLAAVDETIDCVLCGYEGRTLNGLEFLEALRERHPTLPFVLVADAGTEAVAAEAAGADVTEYVPGGFGSRQFHGIVERIERAVGSDRDERCGERLQRRLRKLITHSTDVITVLGPDGTIAFQSPSVERILGFEPSEMVGENAFDFVHPDDQMDVVEAFDRGIEQPDELVEVEWRARTADGDWCWLHSVGTNRLDDPDVDGFVVNHRDVTAERRQERRLASHQRRMDRIVAVLEREFRGPLETATTALDDAITSTAANGGAAAIGTDLRERMREVHARLADGFDELDELTGETVGEDPRPGRSD
jgi:PAS domain S-box-containing protein